MSGSKGVLWFVYWPSNDPAHPDQWNEALRITRQFSQVRNLCLYSDVGGNLTINAAENAKVVGRVLVSEEAIVVILLNDNYTISGPFGSPICRTFGSAGRFTVTVPSWINVDQVSQVTEYGISRPTYSVDGQDVTVDFSINQDSLVYVIGKNDTTAPDAPANLKIAGGDRLDEQLHSLLERAV